jgi:hypothetical protein
MDVSFTLNMLASLKIFWDVGALSPRMSWLSHQAIEQARYRKKVKRGANGSRHQPGECNWRPAGNFLYPTDHLQPLYATRAALDEAEGATPGFSA